MSVQAWMSCIALRCAFGQPIIDGFLTSYSGCLNKPPTATDFFLIPDRSNAKSAAAELSLASGLTAPPFVQLKLALNQTSPIGHSRGFGCVTVIIEHGFYLYLMERPKRPVASKGRNLV